MFYTKKIFPCFRFGLGTIFSKQEQYSLAELHFQRALQINPQNSAIMCHIGVVQHALKKTDEALKTLNTAISNDPDNTLCKFHRASINFSIGRHMEALREFEELKNIVPKESLVYYSIGKVSIIMIFLYYVSYFMFSFLFLFFFFFLYRYIRNWVIPTLH